MKIWIVTTIYDDGDPGDRASLSKVQAFPTLQAAREWFWTYQSSFDKSMRGYLTLDATFDMIENDFGDDAPEGLEDDAFYEWANEQAAKEPEKYGWTNGRLDDGSWNGGDIIKFTEVEVPSWVEVP